MLVQLEKIKPYIAFDKYMQIKAILDRCFKSHRISQLEIDQIIQLLDERSQGEVLDELETEDSCEQSGKTRSISIDNNFALLYNEYCIRLHTTLKKLQEKEKKKSKAQSMHYD